MIICFNLEGFGEYLKEISIVVIVNQNLQFLNLVQVLCNLDDTEGFYENGSFSVHSFNEHYLSCMSSQVAEGISSCGISRGKISQKTGSFATGSLIR